MTRIPLASAERLAQRAPISEDDFDRACAAAWHQRGIVTIDLGWVLPWPLREMVERWASDRWGARK